MIKAKKKKVLGIYFLSNLYEAGKGRENKDSWEMDFDLFL